MKYLFLFIAVFFSLLASSQAPRKELQLWYSQPAAKWTEALPIGNGRLGAMIYGGVKEQIQFNEETLWTGGPRNYSRPGAAEYLDSIRKLLFAGKQKEAELLAEQKFMGLKSDEGRKAEWVNNMVSLKGFKGNPALPDFDDSKWAKMPVPAYEGWETLGYNGLDGSVWFRTTFEVPEQWMGKDLILDLNRVRDHDFTYINGRPVGNTESTEARRYTISNRILMPGKNTIAIQVLNYFDKGGIAGYKDTSRHIGIYPSGENESSKISLNREWKYFIQDDEPPAVPRYQADYQPFGDLWITMSHGEEIKEYKRVLDLSNATAAISYSADGIKYSREYFASQPGQAIVVRLTSDKKGKVSFTTSLGSPHKKHSTRKFDDHTLALSLQVRHGALRGESLLKVIPKGGSVKVTNDKIIVTNADEVILYLTAGTNYINYNDVSGDPLLPCKQALAGLSGKTYGQVKDAHIKEYQKYFNTFSIDLGSNATALLPTNERIERFPAGEDPSLVSLYLQYGRYLLISSSRPGTRPANLQGIWNDLLTPPWGSKYTTNINAEMNYWPAELLNLSPMHEPLFQMIKELSETGKQTANMHYHAPGWVLHHNTDLWRGAAPINAANHGIWVTGGAWLCQHLWERYQFTGDKSFLRDKAYPIMKEAALFFNSFLIKDPKTGWLISTPSNSPENGGLVAGPTMDHQIIRDLFKNVVAASEILGKDKELRDQLREKYKQIAPNQIGKWGQLQEWLEDRDDPDNKHRHVSHLWGLYPGTEINYDESPDLVKAAKTSLIARGDSGTGWSLAWKINFWARFRDGDHTYKMIRMLISPAARGGGSYPNLFDAHPPFQIDGNFGGAAGIGEMFVQSHTKYIDLLAALPSSLPDGEVKGICARGGFVLNLNWKNGVLQDVSVYSRTGNPCNLRYAGKEIRFATEKGKWYRLNGELKKTGNGKV